MKHSILSFFLAALFCVAVVNSAPMAPAEFLEKAGNRPAESVKQNLSKISNFGQGSQAITQAPDPKIDDLSKELSMLRPIKVKEPVKFVDDLPRQLSMLKPIRTQRQRKPDT